MSDYFFVKENQITPIYAVPDEYEEAAYSTIFTFPCGPVPVLAKYKPDEKYIIPDVIMEPDFSISRNIYDRLNIANLYGSNWIHIKLIDKGEHDFMMLQLANEQDVICHEQSNFKRFKRGNISGMKKIVIDPQKLLSIPLQKRLVFRDSAWGFHTFFHKIIVKEIESTTPNGVEFIPIEHFNEAWAG